MKTYKVTATETTRFSMVEIQVQAENKRKAEKKVIAENKNVKGFTVLHTDKIS